MGRVSVSPPPPSTPDPGGAPLPLVALIAGPTATVLNTDPVVTSQKVRTLHGLRPARDWFGREVQVDTLYFQKLAAPVTLYVEAGSAHPLESESSGQALAPDGYLDVHQVFSIHRRSPEDRPVHALTLHPDDGLYPLPYAGRRADGQAWERHDVGSPPRQTFFPDAARLLDEIERTASVLNGNLRARARFRLLRAAPSAGRAPEQAGVDYFPYGYDEHFPPRGALAWVTAVVQQALDDPEVRGVVWLEGSPRLAETLYWLNLVCDTEKPLVGTAAQRPNHRLGADGGQQLVDAIDYVLSSAWNDGSGRDRAGAVLVSDQRIFAAREVAKRAGRPGGFSDLGDSGGVLGTTSGPCLSFVPTRRHGRGSALRSSQLPVSVPGFLGPVTIKQGSATLLPSAIPYVEIVSLPGWMTHAGAPGTAIVDQVQSAVRRIRAEAALGGIVAEGVTGGHFEQVEANALDYAAACGLPVVKVGRDAPGSAVPAPGHRLWIGGGNLTAAKARVLLMASLLALGTLPSAVNPGAPTEAEVAAIRARLRAFQVLFDTH